MELACPDGKTEGSMTLSTLNTVSLTLLSGEGDGLTFSALSSSSSMSLSVSAAMLSFELWFSGVGLSTEMLASVMSSAEVVFSAKKAFNILGFQSNLPFSDYNSFIKDWQLTAKCILQKKARD